MEHRRGGGGARAWRSLTKFSAVYLLPILLLQGLLAARRENRPGAATARMLGQFGLVVAGGASPWSSASTRS